MWHLGSSSSNDNGLGLCGKDCWMFLFFPWFGVWRLKCGMNVAGFCYGFSLRFDSCCFLQLCLSVILLQRDVDDNRLHIVLSAKLESSGMQQGQERLGALPQMLHPRAPSATWFCIFQRRCSNWPKGWLSNQWWLWWWWWPWRLQFVACALRASSRPGPRQCEMNKAIFLLLHEHTHVYV